MTDRYALAAADKRVVAMATGLSAVFNDAGVLDPLDVTSAEVVCRLLGEPDERVRLAAALAVRGTRFGHVCIRLDTIREAVVVDGVEPESIEALPWPDVETWMEAIANSHLVGDGSGNEPLVLESGRLYLERYFRYEQLVARSILDRISPVTKEMSQGEVGATRSLTPAMTVMLDKLLGTEESAQRRAAETALSGRFSVIAGGPGTGKTHTVGAILGALAAEGPESFPSVALCAPTGKAAARLGEAISEVISTVDDPALQDLVRSVSPSTMHRLLGWTRKRGAFVHHADHRLPHDMVIVDEMSMVSLPMTAKLLSAMRDDAALVLVGDPYQLESIEAGTVLTDIVTAPNERSNSLIAERIVVLDRVHRFAPTSPIAEFAEAVRNGEADRAIEILSAGHDQLRWIQGRTEPAFAEMWERLIDTRADAVRLSRDPADPEGALEALNGIAVLCARRRGENSVASWARDIESALDQRFVGLRYGGEWYPGRPVMITSNDHRLDLYNGDIGITVETPDGVRAVFERIEVRGFPVTRLPEHSTVHAMTIHKSQGSQFREVVVVPPEDGSRLLTRELLYTAVTRGQERVYVYATESAIRATVGRSVERASGLGRRLWN